MHAFASLLARYCAKPPRTEGIGWQVRGVCSSGPRRAGQTKPKPVIPGECRVTRMLTGGIVQDARRIEWFGALPWTMHQTAGNGRAPPGSVRQDELCGSDFRNPPLHRGLSRQRLYFEQSLWVPQRLQRLAWHHQSGAANNCHPCFRRGLRHQPGVRG